MIYVRDLHSHFVLNAMKIISYFAGIHWDESRSYIGLIEVACDSKNELPFITPSNELY